MSILFVCFKLGEIRGTVFMPVCPPDWFEHPFTTSSFEDCDEICAVCADEIRQRAREEGATIRETFERFYRLGPETMITGFRSRPGVTEREAIRVG